MCSNRAGGTELIDERETSPAFAKAGYRTMEGVNRYLGGTRVVREFIADELDDFGEDRPLRVLDMGSGPCDIPMEISQWARQRGRVVSFTCLEPNPHARDMAREKMVDQQDLPIRVLPDRVEEHMPDRPYDCAVGSMFFHHFTDEQIVQMVSRLRGFVRRSVLINDLHRTPSAFIGFLLLSLVLAPDVCQDGLHSIRRSFRPAPLKAILERLPRVEVSVRRAYCLRVAAEVHFF